MNIKGTDTFKVAAAKKVSPDYMDDDILFVNKIDPTKERMPEREVRLDTFTFVFCSKGESKIKVDEELYTFGRHDIMVLPTRSRIAAVEYPADSVCSVLCISNRLVRQLLYNERDIWGKLMYLKRVPILHLNEEDWTVFEEYKQLLFDKTRHARGKYHHEIICGLIQALLYELFSYLEPMVHMHDRYAGFSQGDILFRDFLRMLSEYNSTSRFLNYYADKLCVTPKYLSSVCKKVSGRTAGEWIDNFTVERIRRLLCFSDKSVKEIAEELDFPNISFFGKYVKHHLGCSPVNYRQTMQNRE